MPLSDEDKQRIYEEEVERARIRQQLQAQQQQPPPQKEGLGFCASCALLILLGIFCLFVLGTCVSSTPGGSSSPTYNSGIDAEVMAPEFVKDRLKAPSTADFCPESERKVTDMGNHKYTVSGWVDAQNSFGAKIRSYWTVTLHNTGGANWQADDVQIHGE